MNYSTLHCAAESGLVDIAKAAIQQDASGVHKADELQQTPLHVACTHGRRHIVDLLLEHGARLLARDHEQRTPLHCLVAGSHEELLGAVLQRHARHRRSEARDSPDAVLAADANGDTPLLLAAKIGHLPVLSLLLKYHASSGLSLGHENASGLSVLPLCASLGNVQCMSVLIGHIQALKDPMSALSPPPRSVLAGPVSEAAVEDELRHYLHIPWARMSLAERGTILATRRGHVEALGMLVAASLAIPEFSLRALVFVDACAIAAALDLRECLEALFFYEPKVREVNAARQQRRQEAAASAAEAVDAEEAAARSGQWEKELLSTDVIRQVVLGGHTLMHIAAINGAEGVIRTLLAHGASVARLNQDGMLPLHMVELELASRRNMSSLARSSSGTGAGSGSLTNSSLVRGTVSGVAMENPLILSRLPVRDELPSDDELLERLERVQRLLARVESGVEDEEDTETMGTDTRLMMRRTSSVDIVRLGDLSAETQARALLGVCGGEDDLSSASVDGAPRTPYNSVASMSLSGGTSTSPTSSVSTTLSAGVSTGTGTGSLNLLAPTPCNTADTITLDDITSDDSSPPATPYNSVASASLSSAAALSSSSASDTLASAVQILAKSSASHGLLPSLPQSMLELTADDWDKILYGSVCISFARDDLILVEGETNNNLFLITSGAVRVEKRGRFIARIDAKENVFGDIGYLLNKRPSASIISDTKTLDGLGLLRAKREQQQQAGRSTAPGRTSADADSSLLGMAERQMSPLRASSLTLGMQGVDVAELSQTTVRVVSRDVVSYICTHDPIVAGKFHRFLAIQLSRRLRRLLSSEKSQDDSARAPINLSAVPKEDPSRANDGPVAEDKRLVKLRARFNLFNKTENLIGSYHCSWSFNEGKPSDGRIYVTNFHICFYSKFFGFATKYRLARADISDVRKRGDSHIFMKMNNGDKHSAFAFDEERNTVFQQIAKSEVPSKVSRGTSAYSEGEEMNESGQLTKQDWVVLSRIAEHRTYNENEVIVREGRKLSAIYQMLRGTVRIEKDGKVFDRTARSDMFGEVSFLDKEPASASVVADRKCQFYVFSYSDLHREMGDVQFASRLYHYIAQLLARRVTRVTDFLITETSSEVVKEGYLYYEEKWCWSVMSPSSVQIFDSNQKTPARNIKFKNLKSITLVPACRVPRSRKPIVRRLGPSSKDAPASYFAVEEVGKEPLLLAGKSNYQRADWVVGMNSTAYENSITVHTLLSRENELEVLQEMYLPPYASGTINVSLGFSWKYKATGDVIGAAPKSPECAWDGRSFDVTGSSAAGYWNGHRLKWVDEKKHKQLYYWNEKTQCFKDEGGSQWTFFDIVDSEEKMGLTNGAFSMVVTGAVPQPLAMFLYLLSSMLGE